MGVGGGRERRGGEITSKAGTGVADTKRPCSCINSQFITLSLWLKARRKTRMFSDYQRCICVIFLCAIFIRLTSL